LQTTTMAESTSIEVTPKVTAAISLKDVSPEARELLSVIDVDGDGVLQLEELQHAANMLAEYKVRATG
jgi:Ca2+-binding EF-hand superfamily protein